MKQRRRIAAMVAVLAFAAAGLLSATGAGSGARSASWTWSVGVPGDALTAATPAAGTADLRQLAAVGDFALLASERNGELVVGAAVSGQTDDTQLAPLREAAAGEPLLAYTAATPDNAQQQLVGVARADIDQVDATLADGRVQTLPLNQWRGFAYSAADAADAVVSIVGYSAGSSVGALRLPQTAAQTQTGGGGTQSAPVYGLFRAFLVGPTAVLSRVNARTLQPTGPRLQLHSEGAGGFALAPDGRELALVASTAAHPAWLVIVNLATMRIARTLPAGDAKTIRGLSWTQPDRLLVLQQLMKGPYQRNVARRTVAAINPATGARVGTSTLTNKLSLRGSVSTPSGLVLLLGSSGLHGGEMQLVLIRPDGRAETQQLPVGTRKGVTLGAVLTASSTNGHAYVAVAGGVVFDLDLTSMNLTRHLVTAPPAAAKVPPPIGFLQAQTLANNLVVAGMFATRTAPVAQGVVMIDTTAWTARLLDASASRFSVLGNRLLTYGLTTRAHLSPPSLWVGHGLTLYDQTGKRLAHLYGSRRFQNIELTPGFGHVLYNGNSTTVPKPGKRYPPGRMYYTGPNDQLVFGLTNGGSLGGGTISRGRPPLGPPLLLFRGSADVGESADRLTSLAVPAQPARATAAASATAAPTAPAPATTTAAATSTTRYTVSNRGHQVAAKQARGGLFDHTYKLFLLGTRGGTAFYRVQLTAHFTCWGSGKDSRVGDLGSLGCPNLVGAYPLQNEDTAIRMAPGSNTSEEYLRIDGIAVDQAKSMALIDSSGKQLATTPVVNNLYAFPGPYPKTFPAGVRVVALDANGEELKAHPEWGQHQTPPNGLFGPRATRVEPTKIGRIVQHATAEGVEISVGDNSVVVFDGSNIDAQRQRLVGGSRIGFDCFQISGNNVRKTRVAGISHQWQQSVAFKILGYIKGTIDGCEIQGSYGHRWRDQYGTHSAIEVPLTARGRRYFEDRAAARDLALFVRSQKTQQVRKLTGSELLAAVRRVYGDRVAVLTTKTANTPAGTVGVRVAGDRTTFTETSSVGVRFYVQLENGKINKENVRGLAFVF